MIAAFVFVLATVAAPDPSFTCASFGKFFVCKAANVEGMWPHWTLLKRGGNFEAYGPEFRANAPTKWSVIQMDVSDGEFDWTLKAEVRRIKNKAYFRPYVKEKE